MSIRLAAVLLCASLLAACANVPSNVPLQGLTKRNYSFDKWLDARNPTDTDLIVLSFSGGGVRAAALAESVLDQLADMKLSSRIAIISSTSGGSVTAGYVAEHGLGKTALEKFQKAFLYNPNTSDLTPRLLPTFVFGGNRSQIFADYLDERLFPGTAPTYGSLTGNWRESPFVILNASNLSSGRTFEFTQQSFNYLCSDLSPFRLSEGIAASSSFPFLMTPIPLRNHWDQPECRGNAHAFPPPGYDENYLKDDYAGRYRNLDLFTQYRYVHALRHTYEPDAPGHDPARVPYRRIQYVHLIDGGLSDNLAARSLVHAFPTEVVKRLVKSGVRRILLIQVNAKSDAARKSIDLSGDAPSWVEVFKSVAFNPIDVATTLSAYIARDYWVRVVASSNAEAAPAEQLLFYPVQVDFDQMRPNSPEQKKLQSVATWWSLPDDEVDAVRKAGRDLLMAHPCFRAFLIQSKLGEVKPGPKWSYECDETVQVTGNKAVPIAQAEIPAFSPPKPAPPPPVPKPAPAVEKMTTAADVLFDFDKAVLRAEGMTKLDDLARKIGLVNLEIMIVVGHTDALGSDSHNQLLSVRRAEAVKAYLVMKGIPADRIFTEGKGAKAPVASNTTDEGRQKNRRVEIEIIGTRR